MNIDVRDTLEKIKRWFFLMPFGTKAVFITVLSFYILKVFWSDEVEDTCINPDTMWSHIITSIPRYILHSFVHANILHILFNSIALIHFSSSFERNVNIGSVLLVYIVLIFSVLIAVFYSFTAKVLSIFFISKWMNTCTVGISGVLFSFITIESLKNETVKQIRGIEIPSKYNPWILLIFTQLIWPKASFLGHLGGIVIGYLYHEKFLDKIMLQHYTIYSIEQSLPFELSSFVVHNDGVGLPLFNENSGRSPLFNEDRTPLFNEGRTPLFSDNSRNNNNRINQSSQDEDDPFIDILPSDDEDDISAERNFEIDSEAAGYPLLSGLQNNTNIPSPAINLLGNNENRNTSSS